MLNFQNIRLLSTATRALKHNQKVPLITCKRPEFNLYEDQVRPNAKFKSIPLASQAWANRKSKGDYFIIHPHQDEYYLDHEWGPEFTEFDLHPTLIKNLNDEGLFKATWVQKEVIPAMQANEHVLIAAETGCGKTLAYLLPILNRIIKTKAMLQNRPFNTPLVFIMTAGRELTEQVEEVARTLTKGLDINIRTYFGGHTKQIQLHPNFEDIDILIGTMGVISKLTTTRILRMNECRHVVLDEADTLMDDSYKEKVTHLLRRFPFHQNHLTDLGPKVVGTQLVLAAATIPTTIESMLQSVINPETIRRIMSPNLHRILAHVPQKFMRITRADRPLRLLTLAKAEVAKRRLLIVFSNKSATSDYVSMFLNSNGVKCESLNGDMLTQFRIGRFQAFQDGAFPVLSTTDVASRGLNTINVNHVLNFDFPLYVADYIHRCGRTGRVGGVENCQITNFVSSGREVHVVHRIEHAIRTGNELPNVDANVGGIINARIRKKLGDN